MAGGKKFYDDLGPGDQAIVLSMSQSDFWNNTAPRIANTGAIVAAAPDVADAALQLGNAARVGVGAAVKAAKGGSTEAPIIAASKVAPKPNTIPKNPLTTAPAAASGSRPLLSTQQLNSLAVEEYAGRVLLGGTKKEISPAVSIAQDTVTGRVSKVYFNDQLGKLPSNLSDPIASRLKSVPEYVKTKGPGSHAEVYAVDELLKARPGAKLSDIQVLTLETAEAKRLLTVKPPCPDCDHLLEVQYLK